MPRNILNPTSAIVLAASLKLLHLPVLVFARKSSTRRMPMLYPLFVFPGEEAKTQIKASDGIFHPCSNGASIPPATCLHACLCSLSLLFHSHLIQLLVDLIYGLQI
mmetsp:Transcript_11328/g.28695  ORF Transcript_11328/g.28695 Transcript_11328/m.28695 type:complete len:106 (+) Transcript_11328:1356-1673(+)